MQVRELVSALYHLPLATTKIMTSELSRFQKAITSEMDQGDTKPAVNLHHTALGQVIDPANVNLNNVLSFLMWKIITTHL